MTIDKIVNLLEKYYSANGFQKIKPAGLVNEYFREFNPSAGHHIIDSVLKNKEKVSTQKFFVVERCLRKMDIGQVGWSHHLSFWEMSDAAYVGQISKEERENTFRLYKNFFEKELGLDMNKLLITVNGGGKIENLELAPDTESIELWNKVGFSKDKIIPITGRRNFIYAREHGSPGGTTCEIYFDRGEEYPNTLRYLEIASLNMYKYYVVKEPEKANLVELIPSVNISYACAVGLERVCAVLENKKTIYEISNISPLIDIINSYLKNETEKEIYRKDVNRLADQLRAVYFIISDGQEPDTSTRGKILKEVLREIKGLSYFMNLKEKKLFNEFLDKTIEIYGVRHPQLKHNKERVLEILQKFDIL